MADGETVVIEHDFPDVLTHHYSPAPVGADVPLYRGRYRRRDDPEPFDGAVYSRWSGIPQVEAWGVRPVTRGALERMMQLEIDFLLVDGPPGNTSKLATRRPSLPRQAASWRHRHAGRQPTA